MRLNRRGLRSILWMVAALAAGCSGKTTPTSGASYEAMVSTSFVTISKGDVQTFVVKMFGRQNGKWYELATGDQASISVAEPVENTEWKTGEKIFGIVKANPHNVGDVLAGGLTWHQKGRVARAWSYGPLQGVEAEKTLLVTTFRLLEGEGALATGERTK